MRNQPRMNTDKHGSKLIHESLTEAIIGSAFDVLNELGHGFHEKPYEHALVVEFTERGLGCEQQREFDLIYKGHRVGQFVPDLIVENEVVVDTKVIDRITDHEIGQMMNYLRITGFRIGLIINFKFAKLQWKRVVL
jgi:GxxExxY protein